MLGYFIHAFYLGKILHTFAVSIGTLQMLPLVLENSPISCIIAVLLNKILLEIKTFRNFLNLLTHLPLDLLPFYFKLFDM